MFSLVHQIKFKVMQNLKSLLLNGSFALVQSFKEDIEREYGNLDEIEIHVEDIEQKIFLQFDYEAHTVADTFEDCCLLSYEVLNIEIETVYWYNEDHSTDELELSEEEKKQLNQIILKK